MHFGDFCIFYIYIYYTCWSLTRVGLLHLGSGFPKRVIMFDHFLLIYKEDRDVALTAQSAVNATWRVETTEGPLETTGDHRGQFPQTGFGAWYPESRPLPTPPGNLEATLV